MRRIPTNFRCREKSAPRFAGKNSHRNQFFKLSLILPHFQRSKTHRNYQLLTTSYRKSSIYLKVLSIFNLIRSYSQLSDRFFHFYLVDPVGFEPTTFSLQMRRASTAPWALQTLLNPEIKKSPLRETSPNILKQTLMPPLATT